MRLAAKLILLFLFGVLLIVGVFSYLTIEHNREWAMAEHERHAEELAAALRPMLADALRRGDHEALDQLFRRSRRALQRVEIRWIGISAASPGPVDGRVPRQWVLRQSRVTTIVAPGPSGREMLYTYVPVTDGDEVAGSIEVSGFGEESRRRLSRSILTSAVALLSVALLSCGVILVGGIWMVGRPLERLIDKVRRVGQGDFSGPVKLRSGDELGRLGAALNEMCDQLNEQRRRIEMETESRLAAVRQLRHADRLGTVGRLAAGVAHELGTPLSVVSGRAELIASGRLSETESRRSAEIIKSETDRITQIVRELLDFARRGKLARSPQDLIPVLRQTVRLLESMAAKQGVRLLTEAEPPRARARIDAGQIQQVMTNLIVNAIQAMPEGGEVSVSLRRAEPSCVPSPEDRPELTPALGEHDASPDTPPEPSPQQDAREFWRIDVVDSGEGIAEEDLERIFEPFFTTKDVGEGTGLGLAIAYGIVTDHGGWIDVDSTPAMGTRFSVYLPAANEATGERNR